MTMSTKLIVWFCVCALSGYAFGGLLRGAYKPIRKTLRWIAEHDDRALLNRRRKAARDREMRKVESTADRAAQMHEIFADVIHPTTPYCDYLDTPRNAVPRMRRGEQ
jgi:hypothetical protein